MVALVGLALHQQGQQAFGARVALQVVNLLLVVLVEFGLSPRIVSARTDGGNLKLLHALGSAMYFGQWLCAGFALWRLSRSNSPV